MGVEELRRVLKQSVGRYLGGDEEFYKEFEKKELASSFIVKNKASLDKKKPAAKTEKK